MHTDWKAYFSFSKKDRIAAIVLLILIILLTLIMFFYKPFNNQPIAITTLDQELAKQGIDTVAAADEQIAFVPSDETEVTSRHISELFQFDPNTLDAAGFKRLGLQYKTINTILKYRSKGGHFRKADDLRKIYNLGKEEADRLIPYIQIAGQQQILVKAAKQQANDTKASPNAIDINTATAEQWKALPAIGDVLANRIVKFRDKIGGFISVVQVKQTYGLSDSAFNAIEPYLTISSPLQKTTTSEKININTASLNQLKNNPHIPTDVAQAIAIYRSQHGNYASIEDIKKIVFINDNMYQQIAPYITIR